MKTREQLIEALEAKGYERYKDTNVWWRPGRMVQIAPSPLTDTGEVPMLWETVTLEEALAYEPDLRRPAHVHKTYTSAEEIKN